MQKPIVAGGPNKEQIEHWNDQAGPRWVAMQDMIDGQIRPLGEAAMERAAIKAGERVLDVGCGCGQTSLELARRVTASGSVTGIDISAVMLARAQQSAAELGVSNLRFLNADAQTHALDAAAYDVVFSRFGVMFFAHPDEAFTNLCRALRPGGRLAFVCWQALPDNAWMVVPLMAALQHLPPPPLPSPDAPGPFAFADPQRVEGILTRAGFADVQFESLRETLSIASGRSLDEVVDFMLQMGPTAVVMRDADADLRQRVVDAIREALRPYFGDAGVRMPSAAWVVTARRP